MSQWLVWFAYYSEQADVGIVEADSAEEASTKFWDQHGHVGQWPIHGVSVAPVVPGMHIEIDAPH